MSSHVVVLDASARRAVIKTQPSKHLADILQEACAKLGLDPARHGLKSNVKALDLSQPFRLSGLSSGAKLQLVVLSKSPSAVSVALQLPESESSPNRLTNKFPSRTTLWLLLRQFESGTGDSRPARNFTARASPQIDGEQGGSGRLFHETPVVHVMGRELSSFIDLQKNLAQLGFNSGSVLLRLSFRATQRPLEEAMGEIDQYFKSIESIDTAGAHKHSAGNAESAPNVSNPVLNEEMKDAPSPPEPISPILQNQSVPSESAITPLPVEAETETAAPPSENMITGPSQRPIKVFAPPSASSPAAARQAYNEKDYEPTVDHAKLHQSRLSTYGKNKTLLSDAELAAQAQAKAKRKAEVKRVNIKVRFPDQSTVISEFNNLETTASLYGFVTQCLENEDEPFSLNFSTSKGPQRITKEGKKRLTSDLGMTGSVMVNVIWEEGTSKEARTGKPILKEVYRKEAAEIKVKEPEGVNVEEKVESNAQEKEPGKREAGARKGGVPKWFKMGKKG